jgi:hypothetical protein
MNRQNACALNSVRNILSESRLLTQNGISNFASRWRHVAVQSPMTIWEWIHRLVEMLNKTFENVSELDIMINSALVCLSNCSGYWCSLMFIPRVQLASIDCRGAILIVFTGTPHTWRDSWQWICDGRQSAKRHCASRKVVSTCNKKLHSEAVKRPSSIEMLWWAQTAYSAEHLAVRSSGWGRTRKRRSHPNASTLVIFFGIL